MVRWGRGAVTLPAGGIYDELASRLQTEARGSRPRSHTEPTRRVRLHLLPYRSPRPTGDRGVVLVGCPWRRGGYKCGAANDAVVRVAPSRARLRRGGRRGAIPEKSLLVIQNRRRVLPTTFEAPVTQAGAEGVVLNLDDGQKWSATLGDAGEVATNEPDLLFSGSRRDGGG